MCLNYEVRVLCCKTPEGCPLSSMIPYVTSPSKTSFLAPSSSAPWWPSSTASSHRSCFCSVSGQLYRAGSVIYRQTDLTGHCYHALCNQDCQVIRRVDQDCPSTTPPPTPATTSVGTSTSAPVTTGGCPNTIPPRKRGETWDMPNCSQATCEGNNTITVRPRKCPQVKKPTCANGYPAVKVSSQDGCCQDYHCQCVCSGWGDPHYITFDGTYYTFLDNCTYVLVQQIVPVYGHFRVLIDNYFCDAEDGLSCPQSIIVEYHQDRVVLTRRPVNGVMTNQIIFNKKVVSPGFQKNGIDVSRIGIKMYVTIPDIGVQVMFTGLIFSVEVPFSKFTNNTEGQCGMCWAPQATCLRLSPVPNKRKQPFYEGCVFDHCHMNDSAVVCSSLELYASLCTSSGVCIDWRDHTNGTCLFTCPADKVYQACGPSNTSYCYGNDSTNLLVLQEAGTLTEGCFCPDGETLFSTSINVCVPQACSWCLGPHGRLVE
ncbi:PREDICTED: mucin-5AC-like, partial [Galeopterus variegatus]|uniref:Mucin-5AC-like n=1 Tax=Galeopterus variegatus TaxID=482537 RepID=A0ABM0Q5E5_GALVR